MCIRDSIEEGQNQARIQDSAHKSLADTVIDPLPKKYDQMPVSYTHLTLPTSDLV